jgi:hypothetical protein
MGECVYVLMILNDFMNGIFVILRVLKHMGFNKDPILNTSGRQFPLFYTETLRDSETKLLLKTISNVSIASSLKLIIKDFSLNTREDESIH